jgi:hypothetical protein
MNGTKSELEQLRNDLDELASHTPSVPEVDTTRLYKRWRSRRRRMRLMTACAAVLAGGIGVPVVTMIPWGGQDQPAVTEAPTDPPSPIPTASRDPDLDTFDYEGACPDDNRESGFCPIGPRGQREWQRLVEAFDESVTIRPIQLACGGDEDGWACSFQAYLGDVPYDPRVVLPDGTVLEALPPGTGEEELVATWPQIAFFLKVPSNTTGEVTPQALCQRDSGKLVPIDRCDPNHGGAFEVVRGDGATASGKFWRIPWESSLGRSIVTALEGWSEAS